MSMALSALLCGSLILLPMLLFFLIKMEFSNLVSLDIQHISTQAFLRRSGKLLDCLPRRPEDWVMHLLAIACLFLIWKTASIVKGSMNRWAEQRVSKRRLENEAKNLRRKSEVFRKLLRGHQTTAASSMQELKMLRRNEDSNKSQIKELEERSCDVANPLSSLETDNEVLREVLKAYARTAESSAEPIYGLLRVLELQRQVHQDEMESLRSQLERKTKEKHNLECALKNELSQKEAAIEEMKEHFAQFRKESRRERRERRDFQRAEMRAYQKIAQRKFGELLETELELTWERERTAELQRKVDRAKRGSGDMERQGVETTRDRRRRQRGTGRRRNGIEEVLL